MDKPILYCAPGAGLGHLVRACSVALRLDDLGVPCRVLSNSPFARGMAQLTGCAIDFIESDRLRAELPAYVDDTQPRLVVLDTFPWGLRGEWRGRHAKKCEFVYVARRMNVAAYTEALGIEWDTSARQVARVVVTEPLERGHCDVLSEGAESAMRLPGRIRFPYHKVPAQVPDRLSVLLDSGRVWLVVHSGPEGETLRLVRRAQEDMAVHGGGELVVIAARRPERPNFPCFEYFPAARLYAKAFRVVTGAGYNSMADAACIPPEKHIALPFDRKYDDQRARLNGPPAGTADGAPDAAAFIASCVN